MIKYKRILLLTLLSFLLSINIGCSIKTSTSTSEKIHIGVSIVPLKGFVKAVAGDMVEVTVAIPPGYSPESYQPSPSEMKSLYQGEVFFAIGMPAEINFIESIEENKAVRVVHLNDLTADYYPLRYFTEVHEEHKKSENKIEHEHEHGGVDPHIWLSPKRAIIMVEKIRDELISIDPDNKDVYNDNANKYVNEIGILDERIKEIVGRIDNKAFIIYHPSLGYFADDYGMNMISIEENGKDATIETLKRVIDTAKEKQIKTVYYQQEFDSKQAKIIAKEIDGNVAALNLLEEDYIKNIKYLADALDTVH